MVINHLVVTNLRARFRDLSTLGDDFMPTPLPDIKRKYFYAVTEWVVEGHCYCSGHAERCIQQGDESTAVGKVCRLIFSLITSWYELWLFAM